MLRRVVFLFWSCSWPLSASSDDLLRPVEASVEASVKFEHLGFSPVEVMRYRFVYVDSDYLWDFFESADEVESIADYSPLEIKLFEDLLIESRLIKTDYSLDRSSATGTLIGQSASLVSMPSEPARAEILLTKDGSVWADIGSETYQYGLFPIISMWPLHVVVQFDARSFQATK